MATVTTTTTTTTTTEDSDPLLQKLDEVLSELADLKSLIFVLLQGEINMDQEIENLRAQVEANSAVTDSAVQLLTELGDMMRAAADDPAAVRALADQVQAKKDELANAVVANTPQAPPVP